MPVTVVTLLGSLARAVRIGVWLLLGSVVMALGAMATDDFLGRYLRRKATIADRVVQVLVQHEGGTVYVDDHLMYDLGMDSLDSAEVAASLEEEFGITINPEEAEMAACGTVQDFIELVRDKLGLP